jgi:hypothetical protein
LHLLKERLDAALLLALAAQDRSARYDVQKAWGLGRIKMPPAPTVAKACRVEAPPYILRRHCFVAPFFSMSVIMLFAKHGDSRRFGWATAQAASRRAGSLMSAFLKPTPFLREHFEVDIFGQRHLDLNEEVAK